MSRAQYQIQKFDAYASAAISDRSCIDALESGAVGRGGEAHGADDGDKDNTAES